MQGGWEPFFGGRGIHPGWEQARRDWRRRRAVERQYANDLRRIARSIGDIVRGLWQGPGSSTTAIQTMLRQYADMITPWARSVSERMLAEVGRRDAAAWHQLGRQINRALVQEIATAPTGQMVQTLLDAEVGLIRGLALDAEARIRQLSLEAVTGGRRWSEVSEEIADQENVSRARADTIARTETGRAATTLMEARALHVGSPGYIWRTARDNRVRKLHRDLEGSFHRWGDPPVAGDNGERAHPGSIYNCRCFPEVVLDGRSVRRQQGPRPRNPDFIAALRAQGYTTGAAFE